MPTLKEFAEWRTTGQAAREMGKSRQGVTWLLEEGRLRGVKTQAGWLVAPQSIVDFLEREKALREAEE